jgi:hypothetical protein
MPQLAEVIFWQGMATYGYSHPKTVPALYGLKYITVNKLINFRLPCGLSSLRIFPFQELLQKMADSLKGQVYLQANITAVTYEESRTVIQYYLADAAPPVNPPATISCGSTIIAFPQTAEAMKMFIPPNSEKLTQLFEQVKTDSYYSLLFEDSDSAFDNRRVTKYHVPLPAIPDDPARNLLIWKPQDFPASSVVAYYSTPSEKTDEQARDEAVAHYSALTERSAEDRVQDFNPWLDYFPRVDSESLSGGFYKELDSFQGHYSQYYTGGLMNFDMVANSMEHARYLIDAEF